MSALSLLCLARALSAAAADDGWKAVQAGNQVYYAKRAEYDRFQEQRSAKAQPWVSVELSIDLYKDGRSQRVASDAVLACSTEARNDCRVVVDAKRGGHFDVPVKIDAAPSVPPSIEDVVQRPPQGVTPGIWGVVINSGMPRARWPDAAKALQLLSQKNPAAFQKLLQHGHLTYDAVLAALSHSIAGGRHDEQKLADQAARVAEAEAAKVPAQAGPVPVTNKGTAAPQPQAQPAGADVPDDESNPFKKLAKLLGRDDVKDSLKKRIDAFIEEPQGGDAFVSPDIPADKKEMAVQMLEGSVSKWVDEKAKDEKKRGELAALYFLMGEKTLPGWAAEAKLQDLAGDRAERQNFLRSLKPFTVAGAPTDPAQAAKAGPYKGDQGGLNSDNWTAAFLKEAVDKAFQVWNNGKTSDKQIPRDTGEDNGVHAGNGTVGTQSGGVEGQVITDWTADQMYGTVPGALGVFRDDPMGGAVRWRHRNPNENTSRALSLRVCSKTGDYNAGMVDTLCIVDRTHGSDMVARYVELKDGDVPSFHVDDRADKREKSPKYKLSISGGQITMTVLDKDGEPTSDKMTTSVSELLGLRRQYAERSTTKAMINGQTYKVIPQGGWYGSVLYFPVDDKGHVSQDGPALEAVISKYAGGGRTIRASDREGLGYVGSGDQRKGYDLVWDASAGAYKITEAKTPAAPEKLDYPWLKKKDDKKDTATTGTPTKTDPDKPGQPKPAASGDLKACTYEKTMPIFKGTPARYDAGDGWGRFTQTEGSANSTYICAYGDLGFAVAGVVGKDDIVQEGDYLVVKTAGLREKDGSAFVQPGDLGSLTVGIDPQTGPWATMTGGKRNVDPKSSLEWYLPMSDLKGRLEATGQKALSIERAAWAWRWRVFPNTPSSAVFSVFLHKDRKSEHVADVMAAITKFASNSPYCFAGGGVRPEVKQYVEKVLSDPSLDSHLVDAGEKNIGKAPPSILFHCSQLDINVSDPWVVQPSWDGAPTQLYRHDLQGLK